MIAAVAGLVVTGAVTGLNLVILIVVLRRWRELEAGAAGHGHGHSPGGIRAGDVLPPFSAQTLDGVQVSRPGLRGREVLVGFFSLTCKACRDAVPPFAAHAERLRASGGTTLAIVHGEAADRSELAAALSAAADHVIAEDEEAGLTEWFGAANYPSHAWYGPDGVVTAAGLGVSALQAEPALP
ncbi:redoxin domain-containing protein [Streptomyces sp. NPDC051940]|uniref:redoxin domain-containing protein n=1 Tax=Streptomyces sp. NPDC051940 TaxID=3155675 RepID=UPI00342DC2E3